MFFWFLMFLWAHSRTWAWAPVKYHRRPTTTTSAFGSLCEMKFTARAPAVWQRRPPSCVSHDTAVIAIKSVHAHAPGDVMRLVSLVRRGCIPGACLHRRPLTVSTHTHTQTFFWGGSEEKGLQLEDGWVQICCRVCSLGRGQASPVQRGRDGPTAGGQRPTEIRDKYCDLYVISRFVMDTWQQAVNRWFTGKVKSHVWSFFLSHFLSIA